MSAELLSPTPFQLLPPLSADEYNALRTDVAESGIAVPIDVDENDVILDGHHRAWIAAELGIPCPRRVVSGLSDQGKRNYARRVNALRRSLTVEQRREQVAQMRSEGQTQAKIAVTLGVSQQTVSNDLADVTNVGNEPMTITDTLGRKQPAKKAMHLCDCGESFTQPVWHCPGCDHHWSTDETQCRNCYQDTVTVDSGTGEVIPPPVQTTKRKDRAVPRRPLADAFTDATSELTKVTERLERLCEDDRYPTNAEQVATRNRGDLLRAAEALAGVLSRLP